MQQQTNLCPGESDMSLRLKCLISDLTESDVINLEDLESWWPPLCVTGGLRSTIEDTWSGDIITAAHRVFGAQHAPRTPIHLNELQQLRHGQHRRGAPQRKNGRLATPTASGLGIEFGMDVPKPVSAQLIG